MSVTLQWLDATHLPVESDYLRPDLLAGRTVEDLTRLPARIGREAVTLGDLFRIKKRGDDPELILAGDLGSVRAIGASMTGGRILVEGDVGPDLGASMTGGSIEVRGSAATWVGAELVDGLIQIRGSAGDFVGAAYPGSKRGQRGGLILVEGDVGRFAGLAIRRGSIAIGGHAGDDLGQGMIAGSIFGFGAVGQRVGHGMKRGTIALFQANSSFEPSLTFTPTRPLRYPFLTIYLRTLQAKGFPVPAGLEGIPMLRYNGDRLESGQGEILKRLDDDGGA